MQLVTKKMWNIEYYAEQTISYSVPRSPLMIVRGRLRAPVRERTQSIRWGLQDALRNGSN